MSKVFQEVSNEINMFPIGLACPVCKRPFDLNDVRDSAELKGVLQCRQCKISFRTLEGMPDFIFGDYLSGEMDRIKTDNDFFDRDGVPYQAYPLEEYSRVLDKLGLSCCQKQRETLLSLGCGSGFFEHELVKRYYDVFGIDISLSLLHHCRFPKARADMAHLPIADNSYDVVFCAMALHHLPLEFHRLVIREVSRVLKKGGRFILIEPNMSFRAKCLHPISKFMNLSASHEKPLNKKQAQLMVEEFFGNSRIYDVPQIEWLGLRPFWKPIYNAIKEIFNCIPGTDRNEFFVLEAVKKDLLKR